MIGYGQAHGKVILMGEHSVVYGYPAIAIPFFEAKVICEVYPRDGAIWLESDFYTGELLAAPVERAHLVSAIHSSLDYLNQERKDLTIKIKSDLPSSRGLGSSAAVAVAMIRAIFHYFRRNISEQELITLAHEAEKIAHGNPSGIDVLTTAFDRPIWFRKGGEDRQSKELKPMDIEVSAYLVVGDTAILGQTREAVLKIAQSKGAKSEVTEKRLAELGEYTVQAQECIKENEPLKLGDLMSKAHANLKELGVSHPALDRLVDKAMHMGALGAKLTGGGLGGCMICLTDSYQKAQEIAAGLEQEGAKGTWIYPMSKALRDMPEQTQTLH